MTKRVRNRTPSNPADIAARREAFDIVRKGMRYAQIAEVTGLSIHSVNAYANADNPSTPDRAATWASIELLREEAIHRAKAVIAEAEKEHEEIVRRAKVAIADAEGRLRQAESHLHAIENLTRPTSLPSQGNLVPGTCELPKSGTAYL